MNESHHFENYLEMVAFVYFFYFLTKFVNY